MRDTGKANTHTQTSLGLAKKQVGEIWGLTIEVENWWLLGRVEQLLR